MMTKFQKVKFHFKTLSIHFGGTLCTTKSAFVLWFRFLIDIFKKKLYIPDSLFEWRHRNTSVNNHLTKKCPRWKVDIYERAVHLWLKLERLPSLRKQIWFYSSMIYCRFEFNYSKYVGFVGNLCFWFVIDGAGIVENWLKFRFSRKTHLFYNKM